MEFSVDNNFNTGSQVVPAMQTTSSGLEAVLTMLLGGDNTILHQPTLSTDILVTPSLVMDSTAIEPVPSFNSTPPSSVMGCGHHRPEQSPPNSLICNLHKPHVIPQFPTFMFRPAPPIPTMSPSYPTSSMMFTPTPTSQIQKAGITTLIDTLNQSILATPTNHRRLALAGTRRIFIPQAPRKKIFMSPSGSR